MRTRPLVVVVQDTRTGACARYAFLRSPVRVGRSADCEVPLEDAFVSGRHGLLQFDAEEVSYADLGSLNGTVLDGVRLAPDAPAPLSDSADLRIGPLRIAVSRGAPLEREPSVAVAPGALTALMERLARVPDVGAAEVAARRLHAGLVLDRFELVREIGRGGFGVVFEAFDRRLRRRVAVKALRPGERPVRLGEAWLQREAEAAAQLAHPNIVTLHDVGTFEGVPFLVMELLRGEPLDVRLARGALEESEALAVAIDVARALAHAHAAGVIHRDLKPSNVFLVEDGFAKVLDFGFAHVFGGPAPVRGGTPRYMAPEQGEDAAPDPRADVYGAALVLRETLVGALTDQSAADAGEIAAAAPGLAALVSRALERAPADRPDARGWLEGLLAAQRGRERPARVDGPQGG